jgi:hypothetical protein
MPSDGALAELDPVTLAVVKTYQVPPHETGDPAPGGRRRPGHLYYRPDFTHLYRVDIATRPGGHLHGPAGVGDADWPRLGLRSLWVTNFEQDTIWRVNTAI